MIYINNGKASLRSTFKILNMSSELYNDAVYFSNKAKSTECLFKKRRAQRISLICYCSSVEAWINQLLKQEINNKSKITKSDKKILKFIKSPNNSLPKELRSVKGKLYNAIPKAINNKKINWNKNPINEIEDYIKLSNKRNVVVHYVKRNNNVLNIKNVQVLLNQAPDIIYDLFKKYKSLGCRTDIPKWFKV